MIRVLLNSIRRVLFCILICTNLILIPSFFNLINLIPVLILKRSFPVFSQLYYPWAHINAWILFKLHPCDWLLPTIPMNRSQHCILISNHKSWLDILVIISLLQPKMPIIFFIMKSSLIWALPGMGLSSYLFGYPMFKRPSIKALKQNPQLARADITALKESFYRKKPYQCYCLFPEGTRVNQIHPVFGPLGPPKYSSLACLINLMRQHTTDFCIIDIDIIYPTKKASFLDFITQIQQMSVNVQYLKPEEFPDTKNYEADPTCRATFQTYFKHLWIKKGKRIE